MLSFIIILLCVNIDALSFGISYGMRGVKIKTSTTLLISILSTLLFSIPFLVSKFVMGFLDQKICFLINGFFLIILGLVYIIETDKKTPKILNLKNSIFECFIISIDAIFTALFYGYLFKNHIFYIFLYYIFNFFAIFHGNRLFYKFSKISKLNLYFFSGIIFIFLGIFKIFGV